MNDFPSSNMTSGPDDNVIPLDERGQRNPLVDIGAEMAILGTLLASPTILEQIEDTLEPHYFAFEAHVRLYDLCSAAIIEHGTTDPITVRHQLDLSGDFERFGGTEWFVGVLAAASGPITVRGHARVVRELYYRRALSALAQDITHRASNVDGDARALIEDAERALSEMVGDSADKSMRSRDATISSTLAHLEQRHKNPGAIVGVATGLERLDKKLLGMQGANLIIVAGRPSMGKTALVQRFATHNADQFQKTNEEEGCPVGFFSLEMSAEEINERIVSDRTNTPLAWLRSGVYHAPEKFTDVVLGTQALASLPLYIDDTGGLTARGIWARARRMKRRYGIGLVIIDQLSHIRPATPNGRRVEDLGQITKDLKAMAKDLDIPVVLLHQLSRAVDMRDDKRPQLTDLRDSGEIEQDADVVMFVYREQYYLERAEPAQRADESQEKFNQRLGHWSERLKAATNIAEVFIAKQRMGNIGKATVAFHGAYTRFANLDDTDHTSNPQEDNTL